VFVQIDRKAKTIYAGVGTQKTNLYRSTDGGATWDAIANQPTGLRPNHIALASDGAIYISYGDDSGPNTMTDGALYKLTTKTGEWSDITPEKPTSDRKFGYGCVTVDAQHPDTVMTATFCRWNGDDQIYRSIDGGKSWSALRDHAQLDWSIAPWLSWGKKTLRMGHWIGDIEIDPLDSNRAFYVTGWGVWSTNDLTKNDSNETTHWTFTRGIEECVVNNVISPPTGAHVLSVMWDIDGFRHDDLDVSPPQGFFLPQVGRNTDIDFAEKNPDVMARVYDGNNTHGAYSTDGGKTWTAFTSAAKGKGGGDIAVSADGKTFVCTPENSPPQVSRDHGETWRACEGIPEKLRVVSDRDDPNLFFAFDPAQGAIYASTDASEHFERRASDLPKAAGYLRVMPGHSGNVCLASEQGLFGSRDGGKTFVKVENVDSAKRVGFGKAASGQDYCATYIIGKVGGVYGFYRSDDLGANWARINDDQRQFGGVTSITGDPRIYGRVYVGSSNRGVLYADPVKPETRVQSEPYEWKNVKVVAGGFIPNIVYSPSGVAYCRTDIGGFYRWDSAAKKWIPLTDFLGESNYFGGESIAFSFGVQPERIYLAAGMYSNEKAAILRSTDAGKTWRAFPVPFRMGGNEDGRGLGERLAVDPNDPNRLWFGSRHEGLWRSMDGGEKWAKVESFPVKGLGVPRRGERTHGGLSFVLLERNSPVGETANEMLVGSTDPGPYHLFASHDGGETWSAVPGGPAPDLLPVRAVRTSNGIAIAYANGIGPNGITNGGVWRLNPRPLGFGAETSIPGDDRWTDITPDKRPDRPRGGYWGISCVNNVLAVSTMNRWNPGDTVWETSDFGLTWHDIAPKATRDVSLSPYLFWGEKQPKLGWWMAGLALDPRDPNHCAYTTGATIYATDNFLDVHAHEPTNWSVWGDGIEETAVITLTSPTEGAHLLSGFGDIGGFVHDDLDVSPKQGMYLNPLFGNTNTIDYAEKNPSIIVRGGTPHQGQAPLGWSEDGGKLWQPILVPAEAQTTGGRRPAAPALITSADGSTFVLCSRTPMLTRDRGKTWIATQGLPPGARPVADRVDPQRFFALDFTTSQMYASNDNGATFVRIDSTGLPADIQSDAPTWHEAAWPLIATLGRSGDLFLVSKRGLFHSTNRGASFERIETDLKIDAMSFGNAPPGKDYPALFAIGTRGDLKAIWRADDIGKTWIRVNDDQHQYGTRFRCISGDPRVFGRVYVGTDGRGILYADRAK
jgi:photosystem II stability/assembly factor-like uncharacterized protein